MVAIMLIIVIVLTVVASHTHCHFKPPFMEQGKTIVSPARNLTWKELLAYGTSVRFTVRSKPARSEKTGQLYFLDWTLPPVLANRLHISNHLPTNPLHPKIPPWSKQSPTLVVTLLRKLKSVLFPSSNAPQVLHERLPIPYTATPLLLRSIPKPIE